MTRKQISRIPEPIARALRGYRTRWKTVGTLSGLLAAAAVLVATVSAAILADRLLRLSFGTRAILLAAIVGTAGFVAVRWGVLRLLKRMRYREAARRLGGRYPDAEEDLVSAVELASMSDRSDVSRELVDDALDNITRRTAQVDPRPAVPVRPAVEAALVFVLLAGILGIAHALRPDAVSNALRRLVRPDEPYFSYTDLRVESGDLVLAAGDRAELRARLGRRVPDVARFELTGGEQVHAIEAPVEQDLARVKTGRLFEDLAYRVRAGDNISEWHRVQVVPPPGLRSMTAVVSPPDYTAADAYDVEQAEGVLDVVAGSSVRLTAMPLDRGDDPRLDVTAALTDGETRHALKRDEGGRLVTSPLTPEATTEYAIHLQDGFGLTSRNPHRVTLRIVPDRLPRVSVPTPDRDVLLLPNEWVAVEAVGEDEYGLRALELEYRLLPGGQADQASPHWDVRVLEKGAAGELRLEGETELTPASLGVHAGDVLEYRARAADFAGPEAFRYGRSRTYRLTVLSEAEHLAQVLDALRRMQVELLARAAEQEVGAERAGELAEKAPTTDVERQAREAAGEQRELTRDAERIAREMDRLLAEMARNPSSPVGMMSDVEKLARDLRGVTGGEMSEMAKNLQAAAQGDKPEQVQKLSRSERKGRQASEKLRQLAEMARQARRGGLLSSLAAEAERLAHEQRQVRDATAPLARETVGKSADQLDEAERRKVERLSREEKAVEKGAERLGRRIEQAADELSYDNAAAAGKADEASRALQDRKVVEKAKELAEAMRKNVLFSSLEGQEQVAKALDEVAKKLRNAAETDPIEQVMARIDEFIRRQEQINRVVARGIDKPREQRERVGQDSGRSQGRLEDEVSEHAAAIRWLVMELGMDSKTAAALGAAATEMVVAEGLLVRPRLKQGLRHGQQALAYLKAAKDEAKQESQQMQQASGGQQQMEQLLLLWRIVQHQKRLNNETRRADDARQTQRQDVLRQLAGQLAARQGRIRREAERLEEMLAARSQRAAAVVEQAGMKMEASRAGLRRADTSERTRTPQIQAVALLEALMEQQKSQCQGAAGAAAMARMQAMMQMMAAGAAGQAGGGFFGGANAPIAPSEAGPVDDEQWRKVRGRFEEQLGSGAEGEYPPQFRSLLNAYFDRLRAEPGE